jgi:hypothetical protein
MGWPGLLLFVALAVVSGCAHGGSRGAGAVSEVHLFGVPVALNLDGMPGPDGIGVRIYASGSTVARGVEIRQGVLEVLMFDGSVDGGNVRGATARKVKRSQCLGCGKTALCGWPGAVVTRNSR